MTGDSTLVRRKRLLGLLGQNRTIGLEASGGYGKTTFALQAAAESGAVAVRISVPEGPEAALFMAEARRSFAAVSISHSTIERAADTTTLAEAIATVLSSIAVATVVIIDEVQRAGDDIISFANVLAGRLAPPHRLIVAGRRLPVEMRAIVSLRITESELAFDHHEILGLVVGRGVALDDAQARELGIAVEGWPAAAVMAVTIWGQRAAALIGSAPSHHALMNILVDAVLEPLDPVTRQDVATVGTLPLVSAAVVERLCGDGAWARLRASGLPIATVDPIGETWWRVPDPVRDVLR